MNIGFIGAGRMAQALAQGIARCHPDATMTVSDPDPRALAAFQKGVARAHVVPSNREVFQSSAIVFLAVKPVAVSRALQGLCFANANQILVSVVAGITVARLSEVMQGSQVLRVMPNTPALIGQGALALARNSAVSADRTEPIAALLRSVGQVVEVEESQLDAVTGLSGSGPAFVIEFLEALVDGGVKCGLPRDIARALALQTLSGTAELVRQFEGHSSVLKDQVTSPGGTTMYGLAALHDCRFHGAVMGAVEAATHRSRELGRTE